MTEFCPGGEHMVLVGPGQTGRCSCGQVWTPGAAPASSVSMLPQRRPFIPAYCPACNRDAAGNHEASCAVKEYDASNDPRVTGEWDALEHECKRLRRALEYIAHFDDDHMAQAQTLHYDMRGKAREVLGGGS